MCQGFCFGQILNLYLFLLDCRSTTQSIKTRDYKSSFLNKSYWISNQRLSHQCLSTFASFSMCRHLGGPRFNPQPSYVEKLNFNTVLQLSTLGSERRVLCCLICISFFEPWCSGKLRHQRCTSHGGFHVTNTASDVV